MKTIATKIALICLAAVIFLTGMGATIANFCCDNCSDQFFSQIYAPAAQVANETHEQHSCCSHKQLAQKHECDNKAQHSDKSSCCKIERKNTTLDSFQFKPTLIVPFTWVANAYAMNTANLIPENSDEILLSKANDPPQSETPREYLAFIRILII